MNNFHLLEDAFNRRSFYVLGSGASAGIIPMTQQLGAKIVERHLAFGMFSASETKIDPMARRILGDAYCSNEQITQELIKRIHPGAVRAISYQLMSFKENGTIPDQYNALNMAKLRSIIFNFNVDGLANRFCQNHIVINAHGSNPDITHNKDWDEIINICLEYDIEPPKLPNVLLPEREPVGITNRTQYQYAKKLYQYTDYVVFVGYSFGFNGKDMDDWESFIFFTNIFKKYRKPIILISPFGVEDLADMLCESLLRNDIYVIPAYWNHLSSAILEIMRIRLMFPHVKNKHKISLEYTYQTILDKKA